MTTNKDKADAIIALIPVAVQLTGGLLDLVHRLRNEGYEIPTTEELRELRDKLQALDDLSDTTRS